MVAASMDQPPLTSARHPIVQRFRDAAAGKAAGQMVAEGQRLAAEALAAGIEVLEVAYTESFAQREGAAELLSDFRARSSALQVCGDKLMGRISQLSTAPGLALRLVRPVPQPGDLLPRRGAGLVLVAAGVRDPGNLGALVRSAEAAGASGMMAVGGSADPFRDKALRGSSGSAFRLPLRHEPGLDGVLGLCQAEGLQLLVAEGRGGEDCWDVDWRKPTALVVGAEAAGIPAELRDAADRRVRVPLQAPVESLNVAVAAGVLLFEARRQRR